MKYRNILLPIFVLLVLACGLLPVPATPSMPGNPPPVAAEPAEVPTEAPVVTEPPIPQNDFGKIARSHIQALTAIGARVAGSGKEAEAAQYLAEVFTKLGYTPATKKFSAWDVDDETEYTSMNVTATKPGLSSRQIIVGAHYDSVDVGVGADDNASGVGVMLEVAERVANMDTPYTIVFIAFGSEENDLDGSYHYAELMSPSEVQGTIAYVNLDSLAAGDITYVYSDEGKDAFLRDWVLGWASKNNIPLQTIPNADLEADGDYVADYGAFKDKGIPFIYFEATNWNLGDQDGYTQVDPQYGDQGFIWHTQYDDLEYLDATFPGRMDEHMRIFVSALFAVCTEYE
ncbi:MAG: M28 family peptidase [Chloroflexota bacterium]